LCEVILTIIAAVLADIGIVQSGAALIKPESPEPVYARKGALWLMLPATVLLPVPCLILLKMVFFQNTSGSFPALYWLCVSAILWFTAMFDEPLPETHAASRSLETHRPTASFPTIGTPHQTESSPCGTPRSNSSKEDSDAQRITQAPCEGVRTHSHDPRLFG
jgi:hypothetical protein